MSVFCFHSHHSLLVPLNMQLYQIKCQTLLISICLVYLLVLFSARSHPPPRSAGVRLLCRDSSSLDTKPFCTAPACTQRLQNQPLFLGRSLLSKYAKSSWVPQRQTEELAAVSSTRCGTELLWDAGTARSRQCTRTSCSGRCFVFYPPGVTRAC